MLWRSTGNRAGASEAVAHRSFQVVMAASSVTTSQCVHSRGDKPNARLLSGARDLQDPDCSPVAVGDLTVSTSTAYCPQEKR